MATSSADGTGQRLIVVAILLGVAVVVIGQMFTVSSLQSTDGSIRIGQDREVVLEAVETTTEVRDSSGRAAALNGGEVQVNGDLGVQGSESWAFGTYAAVNNSSRNGTVWSLGQSYVLAYNGQTSDWQFWYYNQSSTNSYLLSVDASGVSSLTPVIAERDGQTLRLTNSSGTSVSTTINASASNSAALPVTRSLRGRLDETRSWDRPLNASEEQTYRSDGIEPVAVGNRTARILFDTTGDGVAIEFRGVSGELVGAASRGSGLSGTVMTEGTDFELVSGGPDTFLRPLTGGELEDQPRVFIQTPRGPFEQVILLLGSALTLSSVVIIVAIARRIMEVRDL